MCDCCGCDSLYKHGGQRPRDTSAAGSNLNPQGSQESGTGKGPAPGSAEWLKKKRK